MERSDLLEGLSRLEAGEWSFRLPAEAAKGDHAVVAAFNRLAERMQCTAERTESVERRLAVKQSDLLALQRRLGKAERFAALGALAARLAHELGTPLHSIAGHLDLMLADPELGTRPAKRARIVAGEVDRLCSLIRAHLTRLRAPRPRPVPTDINALVSRIVEVVRPLLGAREIEVALDLSPDATPAFGLDTGLVEQVVMNLVQNALDAMPDGGHLTLRTDAIEDGRSISVADDGHGVAPEDVDRVFEPFFTTKEAGKGTGLGLPLCREIARNHGGDIALDSKPGLGTVVTLTLSEATA